MTIVSDLFGQIGDLGFESIDIVQFVVALEENFKRRDMPFEKLLMIDGRYVDELSVSCYDLPRVKAALRSVRHEEAREVAKRALELSAAGAVKELLRQRLEVLLPSFLVAKRSPL